MNTNETPPDGKTYPIRTLQDIYNLPNLRQVQTCLIELAEAMIMARATNDHVLHLMRENGVEAEQAATWPDVANWTDDGKGEVGFKVTDPAGQIPDIDFGKINAASYMNDDDLGELDPSAACKLGDETCESCQ
jgi:hypothetical protein